MITFQVTPIPVETEGVRFLFQFQPNGGEVLVAKQATADLTWDGLVAWAESEAFECGVFQADLITRESVERAFPDNPEFAIIQYDQWINMPVGSVAPQNMGGAASAIIINNGVCAAQETTTTPAPTTTTTEPPTTTTTETPFVPVTFQETTTSTALITSASRTPPPTLPSTGHGDISGTLPLVGVSLVLFALLLFAISQKLYDKLKT